MYENYEKGTVEVPAAKVTPPPKVMPARPGSKLAQVEDLVIAYTKSRGQRATSGQLLPLMELNGITMSGKVPSKTLASMLSNSNRLNNVPGFGYGPAEWGDKPVMMPDPATETPAVVPAGASSNPGGEAAASNPNNAGNA